MKTTVTSNKKRQKWPDELIDKIGFLSAVVISDTILSNPFYGGSLFICGELLYLYLDVISKPGKEILPKKERKRYILLAPFIAFILISLLLIYPFLIKNWHAVSVMLLIPILFLLLRFIILLFTKETKLTHTLHVSAAFSGDTSITPDDIDHMMNINSYRLYWRMTANTKVAFELSLTFAICYLPHLPFKGFWLLLPNTLGLVALYVLAWLAANFILKRLRFYELGKNAVYIVFSITWMIINYNLYKNYDHLGGVSFYIAYMILCIIITVLASVVISLESDMHIIGRLGIQDFTAEKFDRLKALIHHLSTFYSRFIMLIIISFLAFFNELNSYKSSGTLFVMGKYGFTLLPAAFLFAGTLAALKHPMTKLYEQKLKKYVSLNKEGKHSESLEERLRHVLVYQYTKRIGLRILIFILKPFFHHRLIGKERVDPAKFPSIFVCNHSQIYGPIAAILNLPFYVKPWVISKMVYNDQISAHIQQGTFNRQKWLPKPLRYRAGKILGPVIAFAIQSTEPIPVYQSERKDMLRMIGNSVEALEAEDNILIFPENPFATDGYVTEGIGEFFSGFVNIARDYYRKTGKSVTFYSIYADKYKRTLSFSTGVTFDAAVPFKKEKEIITRMLYEKMLGLIM